MPRKPAIPIEIQAEVQKLVEEFNRQNFAKVDPRLRMILGVETDTGYSVRFKGKYLLIDRISHGRRKPAPICRLTWTGAMDKWEFAIYRYSHEAYDPQERFFTGADKVDGTVTGAMVAGLAAYPM